MIRKDLKCIFPMIPKTATSSIADALGMIHIHIPPALFLKPNLLKKSEQYNRHWLNWGKGTDYINQHHNWGNANEMREAILSDDYFKFVFVRNPWDRMVSSWKWEIKVRGAKESSFEDFVISHREKKKETERYQAGVFDSGDVFWLCSYHDWIYDEQGNKLVNFIGRFENIETDFKKVCSKIGLEDIPLPKKNTTIHKPYWEYYSKKTERIVRNLSPEDVEAFDYTFGE